MNFQSYIKAKDYPALNEYILLLNYMDNSLNERGPKPETLEAARKLAKKLGFRVNPADTIFDYLKGAGRGINDLFRLSALYLSTDVKNRKLRSDLVKDMKGVLNKADRRQIMAFLMQLDRATLGITSHMRHALMSLFGIEVGTYNQWVNDKKYIQGELEHIKRALERMNLDPKGNTWKAFRQFQNFIEKAKIE